MKARCSSTAPRRGARDGEQHPLLDRALAGEEALDGRPGARRLDVGEVAHLADVDADDRHPVAGHQVDRAQHRAVASEAHRHVEAVAEVSSSHPSEASPARSASGCGMRTYVALVLEPRGGLAREVAGLRALVVEHEPDAGHQRVVASAMAASTAAIDVDGRADAGGRARRTPRCRLPR